MTCFISVSSIPPGLDRFNALYDRPEPLVERDLVIEINGRLNAQGEVLIPLDEAQAEAAIKHLAGKEPHSDCGLPDPFAMPIPPMSGKLPRCSSGQMPGVYVALSSEVWPEFQEYERASTTLISAYVGPMLADYLTRLEQELRRTGVGCSLQIMQSSGAVMPASMAARKAVYSVESGPAAGVIATAQLGQAIGRSNLISFDMGGTTAKVGLIQHGKPTVTHDFRVGTGVSAETQGQRRADQDSGNRPRRSRSRRRQHRAGSIPAVCCRSARPAPEPHLDRPVTGWADAADGDRRQRGARLSQPRLFPRRQDDHLPGEEPRSYRPQHR